MQRAVSTATSFARTAILFTALLLTANAAAGRPGRAKKKTSFASVAKRLYSPKNTSARVKIMAAASPLRRLSLDRKGLDSAKKHANGIQFLIAQTTLYALKTGGFGSFPRPKKKQKDSQVFLPRRSGEALAEVEEDVLAAAFLSSVADTLVGDDGYIDNKRVELLMDLGDSLIGVVQELIDSEDDPRIKTQTFLRDLVPQAQKLILLTEPVEYSRPTVPSLRWISKTINTNKVTRKAFLLARQHVLGDTASMLNEAGIRGPRGQIWGKPYSLDAAVGLDLEQQGFRIHGSHPKEKREQIEGDLERVLARIKKPQRLKKPLFLILDDGGELISLVADIIDKSFPNHAHLFAGIEQTTKGSKKLAARSSLPFRVIDVGRSARKADDLSPVYGQVIANRADAITRKYAERVQMPLRKATVIGFGNIGRSVAKSLKAKGYTVTVFDRSSEAIARAKRDGFQTATERTAALHSAELLVTSTGATDLIVTEDLLHLPIRSVIVNGGSEGEISLDVPSYLDGGTLLDGAISYRQFLDFDGSTRVYNVFANPESKISATTKNSAVFKIGVGKQIYVTEDGGVVNFPRDSTSHGGSATPTRYSQLDVGMLYLAMIEAMEGGTRGLKSPRADWQDALFELVQTDLAARGESFDAPLLD